MEDLNVSAKTIKLSRIRENLHDTEFGNEFLEMTLKAQARR
jgi:hypothetical protein